LSFESTGWAGRVEEWKEWKERKAFLPSFLSFPKNVSLFLKIS